MEPATTYILMPSIICVCLGLVTAKIAIDREVPGSAFLWLIAGTVLAVVALPAAIFFKPIRKLSSAKISLRANQRNAGGRRGVEIDAKACRFCQHEFLEDDRKTRSSCRGTTQATT